VSAAPAISERRERDELEEHDEGETRVSVHQCLRCVKRCSSAVILFTFLLCNGEGKHA
jgi:hypothetical protein